MSKAINRKSKSLEFLRFWVFIANQLGCSRLNINPCANDIHNLFDPRNDSEDYLKKVILKSYKLSRCDNLKSQISLEAVLDSLGETAYQLRSNHLDDLFDIELLEEIAWHISDRYIHFITIAPSELKQTTGQIVSFPQYKIRIANMRL